MRFSYRFLQLLARTAIRAMVRIRVEGLENLPSSGPFILAPNHQCFLDFLFVQGMFPGEVHTMTKSTQFSVPVIRSILVHGGAFPVRRYRVDAQAVRTLRRKLAEGRVVCLYPEGERSWDGRLQPLRRGALNVFLGCGVPVVPVGIEGSYEFWPRWTRRPRWGTPVTLRFGTPLDFGAIRGRRARARALPDADRSLRRALLELSGQLEGAEARDSRVGEGS
jgi:1-acyl-sn-glycerol-3-phosphate acyltransferase